MHGERELLALELAERDLTAKTKLADQYDALVREAPDESKLLGQKLKNAQSTVEAQQKVVAGSVSTALEQAKAKLAEAKAAEAAAAAAVERHEEAVKTATDGQAGATKDAASAQILRNEAKAAYDRVGRPTTGMFFWVERREKDANAAMKRLGNPVLLSPVYTTEKVIVLLCGSRVGDGATATTAEVPVNGPDFPESGAQDASFTAKPGDELDRVLVLDGSKVKENTLQTVIVSMNTGTDTSSGGNGTDTVGKAVLARHKVLHFSVGGGLLVTNGPTSNYTVTPVTATATTLTQTTVTDTLTDATTGAAISTSTPRTDTSSTTAAAAAVNYVFGQKQANQQFSATAGVTIYPFGYDSYPASSKHGTFTGTFSSWRYNALGIFLGTSVNSFGNFTVAPSYEVLPGVQLAAGATWRQVNLLSSGVTTCSGLGTSPSFSTQDPDTKTTTTSSVANNVKTVETTTTKTTVTLRTGCGNGNVATMVSGTTAPVQQQLKAAFTVGVLFNTNLFKSIGGLLK